MKITVVVPIISFNYYSRQVMVQINSEREFYQNLEFLFVCSFDKIEEILISYLKDFITINNVMIVTCYTASSNHLRKLALNYINTSHIYYQDCDDSVNYHILNSYSSSKLDNEVYCFNINRVLYNNEFNVTDSSILYPNKEVKSLKLNQLPTNIVNKIIPLSTIKLVSFYNLPFTQDWSISYQLFLYVNHKFVNKNIYQYNNYSNSSAHISNTKLSSLKRVHCMKKILTEMYANKGFYLESSYLEYRYDLVLQNRYASVGFLYFPRFQIIKLIKYPKSDYLERTKIIYNLIKSYTYFIRYYFQNNVLCLYFFK